MAAGPAKLVFTYKQLFLVIIMLALILTYTFAHCNKKRQE